MAQGKKKSEKEEESKSQKEETSTQKSQEETQPSQESTQEEEGLGTYQPKHRTLQAAGLDQHAVEEQRQAEKTAQREEHNERIKGRKVGKPEDSENTEDTK